MNPGTPFVGLFAAATGLATALSPQGMIDATCRGSPLCRSLGELSPTGRSYNRFAGGALALVGVLLLTAGVGGTFD